MRRALRILFVSVTACALPPAPAEWSPSTDPLDLAARYAAFVDTLDAGAIEERYRAAVEKIRSEDRETKLEGVRTLAATGEIEALAWMVPLLDDDSVRIWTGSYLSGFVERHALVRRDVRLPEAVVVRPLGEDEIDLRPLAWIVFQMLRQPDDGNSHAYAATMICYLGLHEFVPLLEPSLESRHPAVRRSAETTIAYLELQKSFEAHPEREHPDVQRALGRIEVLHSKHREESLAWSQAGVTPEPHPMSQRFLRAYPDGEGLRFDPPDAIDWEVLAPAEYKHFEKQAPPAALRKRLVARIDMFDNAELTFIEAAPSSFESGYFYLIAENGIHPLTVRNLRGIVRFGFDVDHAAIVERIFYGEVLATLADEAQPAGGFVVRVERPMPQEREAVTRELASEQYGQSSVLTSYGFRIVDGGENFTFVRFEPDDVECEFALSIFGAERELSWNAYGCDI